MQQIVDSFSRLLSSFLLSEISAGCGYIDYIYNGNTNLPVLPCKRTRIGPITIFVVKVIYYFVKVAITVLPF